MKKIIPLFLLLTACTPGSTPAQTSGTSTGSSLIVQSLTPICSSTLKDQKVIPQQALNLGVNETAVCECGLRRVESKLTSNPALLVDLFRSTDAQIKILVAVGTECSGELLQKAILGQILPSPSPTYAPGNPYPSPSPSYYPYPTPVPTYWPPTGP